MIPSKLHLLEVQLLFPDTQTVPKPRRILGDAFHFPREGKPPLLVVCHLRRYHGPDSVLQSSLCPWFCVMPQVRCTKPTEPDRDP